MHSDGIEDASLRYTGIESHERLSHYGLYDTVVAREQLQFRGNIRIAAGESSVAGRARRLGNHFSQRLHVKISFFVIHDAELDNALIVRRVGHRVQNRYVCGRTSRHAGPYGRKHYRLIAGCFELTEYAAIYGIYLKPLATLTPTVSRSHGVENFGS